jgi:hypothetical protein
MSNWENRPKYNEITREVIAQVSDDLLPWAIFDYISLKVGKDGKRTFQILEKLPRGFHILYHLFALDGEIGNGGFNQYFFNGLDKWVEQQIEALKLIGATKHQRILQKAFEVYNQEKQNEELQKRYAERTLESFFSTYGMTKLGECDKKWYALDKEFDALLARFIRSHPELFITKTDAPPRKEKARQ